MDQKLYKGKNKNNISEKRLEKNTMPDGELVLQ
jgi:hypothetical protein